MKNFGDWEISPLCKRSKELRLWHLHNTGTVNKWLCVKSVTLKGGQWHCCACLEIVPTPIQYVADLCKVENLCKTES